ncbi:predicted protein [Naegleria gruberi]|uniref:Spindle pole body component n=1 Tax=Naegleria gruberi TaxID=5762 RepID=D2UYJ2_NAEGR|nr:uncharacterized protein NAEGRDRAFT_45190 [Naegleria gruberi]EFC50803.1 predicted protein [Naegleria gruberi]|eukprot:XP_002683547.1 predicted protein [Naegleria gruberi strain NEG-M]
MAFKQGLQEILEGYLRILTKAEQEFCVFEDDSESETIQNIMPLTYLKQLLRDYEIIFPKLLDIIQQVESENLIGARLLDFLHNSTFSGIPIIEATITKLLFHCNVVLMKQISAWMIYGIISNQSEFFIYEDNQSNLNNSNLDESISSSHANRDNWNKQFVLNTDEIPSYISLRVAHKILFIGKAIKVLQTFNTISNTHNQYKLPNDELVEFKQAMNIHETKKRYNSFNFEFTIDKIRMTVGGHLWNLVVSDCDLLGHIKSIRDYFFLGMGDFFLYLIEDLEKIFSQHYTPQHLQKDLKNIFKQASSKSSAEGEKFLNIFTPSYEKIILKEDSTKFDLLKSKHWPNEISLQFRVGWPLNLFFTEDIIELYNDIFQFMLTCKRMELKLSNSWLPLTRSRSSKPFPELSWTLVLRSKMSNFMYNLQFYLHTEVTDSEFMAMEKSISTETKDFETARKIHTNAILKIHQRCFLNKKQIMIPIYTIFDQCTQLCEIIYLLSQELTQANFQKSASRLEQVEKEFERNRNLLVQIAPFLFSIIENKDDV